VAGESLSDHGTSASLHEWSSGVWGGGVVWGLLGWGCGRVGAGVWWVLTAACVGVGGVLWLGPVGVGGVVRRGERVQARYVAAALGGSLKGRAGARLRGGGGRAASEVSACWWNVDSVEYFGVGWWRGVGGYLVRGLVVMG